MFWPKKAFKIKSWKAFKNDFETEEQAVVYTLPVLVVPLNKKLV